MYRCYNVLCTISRFSLAWNTKVHALCDHLPGVLIDFCAVMISRFDVSWIHVCAERKLDESSITCIPHDGLICVTADDPAWCLHVMATLTDRQCSSLARRCMEVEEAREGDVGSCNRKLRPALACRNAAAFLPPRPQHQHHFPPPRPHLSSSAAPPMLRKR